MTARIGSVVLCVLFALVGWKTVLTQESATEKQERLISESSGFIESGIYVTAVELLEEGLTVGGEYTQDTIDMLKETYLVLGGQKEYSDKYIGLLEMQIEDGTMDIDVFFDAADYYFRENDFNDALNVLKLGISRTGSSELTEYYEENRYVYKVGSSTYDDVTDTYGGLMGARMIDGWGVATSSGILLIDCMYDSVTIYSKDKIVVEKDDEIYVVNSDNNRIGLLQSDDGDIINKMLDKSINLTTGSYILPTDDFDMEALTYDSVGRFSDSGYAAASENGIYGLIDVDGWVVEPAYTDIKMDSLGNCFNQGCMFVTTGNKVYLWNDEELIGNGYEDAKPFNKSGYAAVKQNGLWGYIDTNGEEVISCQFDEVESFSGHLAAVKVDDLWGYIRLDGTIAIEPIFDDVKTFYSGVASVKIDGQWKTITLEEDI